MRRPWGQDRWQREQWRRGWCLRMAADRCWRILKATLGQCWQLLQAAWSYHREDGRRRARFAFSQLAKSLTLPWCLHRILSFSCWEWRGFMFTIEDCPLETPTKDDHDASKYPTRAATGTPPQLALLHLALPSSQSHSWRKWPILYLEWALYDPPSDNSAAISSISSYLWTYVSCDPHRLLHAVLVVATLQFQATLAIFFGCRDSWCIWIEAHPSFQDVRDTWHGNEESSCFLWSPLSSLPPHATARIQPHAWHRIFSVGQAPNQASLCIAAVSSRAGSWGGATSDLMRFLRQLPELALACACLAYGPSCWQLGYSTFSAHWIFLLVWGWSLRDRQSVKILFQQRYPLDLFLGWMFTADMARLFLAFLRLKRANYLDLILPLLSSSLL